MKKLLNITFEREINEYPDLSYLGEIKYQKETNFRKQRSMDTNKSKQYQ